MSHPSNQLDFINNCLPGEGDRGDCPLQSSIQHNQTLVFLKKV